MKKRSKNTRRPLKCLDDLKLLKELKKIDKELDRRGGIIADGNAVAVKVPADEAAREMTDVLMLATKAILRLCDKVEQLEKEKQK